jgi:plastocyanin
MTRRRHLGPGPVLVAAIGVAALLVLAACGSSASGGGLYGGGTKSTPPSAAAPVGSGNAVTIANFAFSPAKLTVKAGTKVTWTNQDSTTHNVASTNGPGLNAGVTKTFSSGNMGQAATFSFTFTKPGTYYYECTIHATMPSMHAVVIVK